MKHVFIVIVIALLSACGTVANDVPAEEPTPDAMSDGRPSEPAGEDYRADVAEHVAATGNPQLIEFFAYWCTTCARVRPVVHALEAEYWGQIDFVYLDIDDSANRDIMDEYGYTAQPYFVLIEADGTVVQTWFGYNEADTFRSGFDEVLGVGR